MVICAYIKLALIPAEGLFLVSCFLSEMQKWLGWKNTHECGQKLRKNCRDPPLVHRCCDWQGMQCFISSTS